MVHGSRKEKERESKRGKRTNREKRIGEIKENRTLWKGRPGHDNTQQVAYHVPSIATTAIWFLTEHFAQSAPSKPPFHSFPFKCTSAFTPPSEAHTYPRPPSSPPRAHQYAQSTATHAATVSSARPWKVRPLNAGPTATSRCRRSSICPYPCRPGSLVAGHYTCPRGGSRARRRRGGIRWYSVRWRLWGSPRMNWIWLVVCICKSKRQEGRKRKEEEKRKIERIKIKIQNKKSRTGNLLFGKFRKVP